MITTENLTKNFDSFTAVDKVTLNIPAGQILALLGPNGAGKTTTVRMLTSILTPTAGSAQVAGYDVVTEAEMVRASVGVLTEHHGLYSRMNAIDYLIFFGTLYDIPKNLLQQRILNLIEKFGLQEALKKRLGEYSKGMRQKLALVRALLHDPPVLLLDEPTSAMDPESARIVRNAIQSLKSQERTIILCTHNLAEAEELADQIAIIRHGKILYNHSIEELKRILLGPVVFEMQLASPVNNWTPNLPDGITLISKHDTFLTFQIEQPHIQNPKLLNTLLQDNFEIISFQEKKRSLEQAYLEAINPETNLNKHV